VYEGIDILETTSIKARLISLRKLHPTLRKVGSGDQKVINNVPAGLIYSERDNPVPVVNSIVLAVD
jgi:hypothetical protein